MATTGFSFAVNRCERGSLFTSIDIGCVLQGSHVFEIKEGGMVVEELLGAGLADDLIKSKNSMCMSIYRMLEELIPPLEAHECHSIEHKLELQSKNPYGASSARMQRRRKKEPKRISSSRTNTAKGLLEASRVVAR